MIKKCIFFVLIAIGFTGCLQNDVIVETTKPWENHYYTVREFRQNTKHIKLEENESIWVLSNTTLSRLLKNTGKLDE